VFRRNDPEALEVDLYVKLGAFVREHIHPSQEETFAVVAGTFVLDVDGQRRTVEAGFNEVIPRRMKHGFDPADGDRRLRRPRSVHQRPPWPLSHAQLVEQADRMLASVAGEVTVMSVDHRQAGAHVAGEVEGGDAGTECEGREGVSEIVDPA
jgi:hypothetical protein